MRVEDVRRVINSLTRLMQCVSERRLHKNLDAEQIHYYKKKAQEIQILNSAHKFGKPRLCQKHRAIAFSIFLFPQAAEAG